MANKVHSPPCLCLSVPLNLPSLLMAFNFVWVFLSTALNRRSASPLITASGDYGVRGKVAEFALHVAGPSRAALTVYLTMLVSQVKYARAIVSL